jgi:hypothetical protein
VAHLFEPLASDTHDQLRNRVSLGGVDAPNNLVILSAERSANPQDLDTLDQLLAIVAPQIADMNPSVPIDGDPELVVLETGVACHQEKRDGHSESHRRPRQLTTRP